MAIDEINAAGGIKSMGGAKLEAALADSQSRPEIGVAEVERLQQDGVSAYVGCFASAIALAATQAAAKYNTPFLIDVGVSDLIVSRGLKNVFRLAPGFGKCVDDAIVALGEVNKAANGIAKTAVLVHEESEFGTGTAKLLAGKMPSINIQVAEVIKHANPTRDFNNIVLRMKAVNPDIVIPANYYNEYALLVRTMQQQRIVPKAIYSVLGGAASQYKFVQEFPEASNGIIDCNHWFNPKDPRAQALRKRVEAQGKFFNYEVFLTYTAMMYLADAIENAKSRERGAITQALANSTFSDHIMPYAATKVVNGQNTGARPLMTQVLNGDIKVIFPTDYREAAPLFPMKG